MAKMDTTAVSSFASSTLEGPLATFTPALEPPPGVVSNPINPPSLTYQSKITIAIAVPLTSLFFFARCYVRLMIKRTWIFEDCNLTLSLTERTVCLRNTLGLASAAWV